MSQSPLLFRAHFETPLGWVEATATEAGLRSVRALDEAPAAPLRDENGHLRECERQLGEYFRGERRSFDLALDAGGTAWQQRVWEALCGIPYGETTSYGQLARQLDSPGASRAVGAANGRNPIWVIVPCHRVIGASGSLTGYAGGLSRKQQLLDLERRNAVGSLFSGAGE